MMQTAKRQLQDLRENQDGAAALEAALYLPTLLVVVQAVMEFGMIMFVSTLLEGSLREASRYGITGQQPVVEERVATIRSIIDDTMIDLVDVDEATIEIKTYPSFADIETGEPFIDGNGNSRYDEGETYTDLNENNLWDEDIGVDGPGGAGEVVRYTIQVEWPIMTPLMAPFLANDNGGYPIRASMTVRNEPWEN